ncbi:MAG TPA: DUF1207 domain-containing protein [Tepidisphaeraceae bacterium]|jgi:hypothetical protein|nr:DUF1207 domain-containing protein [Tepidisphaeraceae bacterium]
MKYIWLLAIAAMLGSGSTSAWAAEAEGPGSPMSPQDAFIAGYASAVLEHDFHLEPTALTVDHGAVTVTTSGLGLVQQVSIREALFRVQGVHQVEFVEAKAPAGANVPTNVPLPVPAATPAPPGTAPGAAPSTAVQTNLSPHPWTFLAPTGTFDPLLADPRWPHFFATYDRYIGHAQSDQRGEINRDAGNVGFGESLSLIQWAPDPSSTAEVGIQAGLFADFDLDQNRVDLIDADYFVGPILAYRRGDFSTLFRIYHQSSHYGDNYLLNNPGAKYFELSYEQPNVIFSYDLFRKSVRIYAGGGYLIDTAPSNLRPGIVEYGVEFYGRPIFDNSSAIPVAAVDFQNHQDNGWGTDISARVGLQFQNPTTLGRQLDLMLEYYDGHSPNGQFFLERIQEIGIGLHFYL